jgi:hypothetical protein
MSCSTHSAPGSGDVDSGTTGMIVVGSHLARREGHSGWNESDESWIKQVFATVHGAAALLDRADAPTLFATVTALNGGFGLGDQHKPLWNPVAGSLAGLAKTASQEWARCQ